jgi:hypothetical protein
MNSCVLFNDVTKDQMQVLLQAYAGSFEGAHFSSEEVHQALDETLLPMTASKAAKT